ncbi:restriction endonuclease subunit R [Komarekiella sp. 'clone 1']|uniref:Restriction endonuclease subunit R n=1 Tax=Komarekiella delphini-convector SJRDD-AB1 TaxID=2593771 RepID=A0AA40VT90_9NOST|nr:type I restriction endonuclease [Komarekiella delphini-convector]MBD6618960.1 restriction endonuclease subunit R [Komarekiella delphini-convector SJRDD-AB1]
MGFTEDIAKVSEHVRNHADKAVGEQATKMALIVPFLSALGYDVYDPNEFKPEYVADFAIKKAGQFEKVDYALAINGNIVMIVEAKAHGQKPETHDGQLSRYFNALVTTKVAVVANGIEYRFFTDLRQTNVMDKEPFFAFNILEYDAKDIDNLKFFHRDIFEAIAITSHAEEMVYLKGMTHLVGNLLRSPSDQFVRFLVSELRASDPRYELQGNINAKVIEKFKSIVKKSLQGSLLELMTRSLSQEMAQSIEAGNISQINEVEANDTIHEPDTAEESKIVTTAEELDAFEKIKAILKTSQNYKYEIQYKDTVSYFGINLGKTTWWFLRLYLSSSKKTFITRLGIDEVKLLALNFLVQEVSTPFGEITSKVTISCVDDLDKLASLICRCYEVETAKH